MSTRRFLGLPLAVLALSACATRPASHAPAPLKPEGGPDVSIRVGYTGGLMHRNVTAYFRTELNSYVLVGHLGGDGVIRVLYPTQPGNPGFVTAKKSYSTESFAAQFDGIPSLFSYSMSPYRSLSSLHDSYDGRGHGYVFVIASRRPLRTGALDDNGQWLEWEVADYSRAYDPRYAVRDFAAAIAPGEDFTLRFASSFTSSRYDAYASQAWDCAMLSSLGFSYSPFWNSWGGMDYMPLSFWRNGTTYGSCGYRSVSRYAWVNGGNFDRYGVPVATPTPTTPGEPAPDVDRPARRGLGPRTGETTRELTATSLGLVKRTVPTERTEIVVHRTADRPTLGQDRPRRRESQDLTTRVAAERRAERARDPVTASPRQRSTERRSEPARTESARPSSGEARSGGETRGSSAGSGSRDTGRPASPRDGRRPDGE